MDQIHKVLLLWIVDERHARVCPSQLPLSPSWLGCRFEVFVQFPCYRAPGKGKRHAPFIGFCGFFACGFQWVDLLFLGGSQLLGVATEQLSLRLGQTLSGLLNASFGNAVEIIVGVAALLQGTVSRFASPYVFFLV